MSFSGWMTKETMVHPDHRLLLSTKKERDIDSLNNLDDPRENYAEWEKPISKNMYRMTPFTTFNNVITEMEQFAKSATPGAGGTMENKRYIHSSCLGSSFVLLSDKMEFLKTKNLLTAFGSSWITDVEIVNARSQAGVCRPGVSTLSRFSLDGESWGEKFPFL